MFSVPGSQEATYQVYFVQIGASGLSRHAADRPSTDFANLDVFLLKAERGGSWPHRCQLIEYGMACRESFGTARSRGSTRDSFLRRRAAHWSVDVY